MRFTVMAIRDDEVVRESEVIADTEDEAAYTFEKRARLRAGKIDGRRVKRVGIGKYEDVPAVTADACGLTDLTGCEIRVVKHDR